MSSPQPIWFCEPAMKLDRRRVAYQLIGLAEVLHSQGRIDEACRVAASALGGFLSLGEKSFTSHRDMIMIFIGALEYFTSDLCQENATVRNHLIRLYGKLLNTRFPNVRDWDSLEHPILRSCVLHAIAGGDAAGLADLQRKTKAWKICDPNYFPTTQIEPSLDRTRKLEANEYDEELVRRRSTGMIPIPDNVGSETDHDDDSTVEEKLATSPEDDDVLPPTPSMSELTGRVRKIGQKFGVTERHIRQRDSKIIREWLNKLGSH